MDELFDQTKALFMNAQKDPQKFTKRIAFNVIPQIDQFMPDGSTREEWKMAVETRKILGADIQVAATCVRVGEGSWFDALPDAMRGRLDVVVSNPPYIAVDDPAVEPIVRDWEPALALFAGADGLDHLRTIATDAPAWLAPGGTLLLEIGADQGAALSALLHDAGLTAIEVVADLTGRTRFVQAKRAAT
jgi:methylase of polypeptide subunit release factors